MTNEERQRAMDFIVQQQAETSAKIDALTETQNRAEERWSRTEGGIQALFAIAEIHEREINTLSHQISSVSRDVASLPESTKAADERLNALINGVERQLINGRNGK